MSFVICWKHESFKCLLIKIFIFHKKSTSLMRWKRNQLSSIWAFHILDFIIRNITSQILSTISYSISLRMHLVTSFVLTTYLVSKLKKTRCFSSNHWSFHLTINDHCQSKSFEILSQKSLTSQFSFDRSQSSRYFVIRQLSRVTRSINNKSLWTS